MQLIMNKQSAGFSFGNLLVLVITLLVVSLSVQAQDKPKEKKHDKMKMEKAEKAHCDEAAKSSCSNEAGMGCCSSGKTKVSEASVAPWNEVCPIRGEKVNKEVKTVMYNGKAYGFCCPGCDEKFGKDPAKYSGNLSEDGKTFIKKNS